MAGSSSRSQSAGAAGVGTADAAAPAGPTAAGVAPATAEPAPLPLLALAAADAAPPLLVVLAAPLRDIDAAAPGIASALGARAEAGAAAAAAGADTDDAVTGAGGLTAAGAAARINVTQAVAGEMWSLRDANVCFNVSWRMISCGGTGGLARAPPASAAATSQAVRLMPTSPRSVGRCQPVANSAGVAVEPRWRPLPD